MFLVVFGDIHIDDFQNIFPSATVGISQKKEKLFEKQQKIYLENISTNLTLWLGFYKIHNKQFVEIISLSKFPIP